MDLSWNPFSCGGLYMSAPDLVEKLRKRRCPLSTQFLTALSLCHTVMAEWNKGCACWSRHQFLFHLPSENTAKPWAILQRTIVYY